MAKQEKAGAAPAPACARALVDVVVDGVRVPCGRLIVGSASAIAALVASGDADDHPDAIAEARRLDRDLP